jgi:RPA family protein
MKLRYLFSAILSSAFLFAGCQPDTHESFDNVKLSQSYLSIPEDGGSVEMTVTSNEAWKFIINEKWPEVVTFNKDADGKTIKAKFDRFGNLINDAADIKEKTPSWLAVSVLEGKAGDTKVTFSAEGTVGGREIEVALLAGNNKQFIRVRQGVMEATAVSCKEANELPEGKSVILKGTVTAIENTTYGNWTLVDDTGSMYIYGTLDKKGATKNFASLGLEAGDVVEVEGPIGSYNGKKQLVNVMVNSITKSLVKLVSEEQTVSKDGGEFDVTVAYKGESILPSVPQEYRSWVSIVDMRTVKGIPTKIEQNPADTAFVKISLQPNTAGDRTGAVAFSSSKGASTSSVTYNFTQEGAIIDATAAEINAAEDGATVYRYTGYITRDTGSTTIYVKDATGEVYCYGVLNEAGETQKWKEMGINVGDIVTVTGPKTSFNGAPQLKNVSVENHIKVTDISLADFRNLPDDKNTWYRISGKVGKSTENGTKHDLENYGNFALFDGATQVYVYGVKNGWGGPKGEFGKLGVKEGDDLTIVCYKTSFNGLIEADGCFYVSHTEGGSETPEPGPGGADYETTLVCVKVDAFYDDGVATINGVPDVKVLKFGTTKKAGECVVMIPADSKKIVFYGIGWSGKDDVFTASFDTFTQGEVTLKANPGATGNSPYTITATGSDYYTIEFNVPIEEEMPLTLKSTARCIIWGLQAKTE